MNNENNNIGNQIPNNNQNVNPVNPAHRNFRLEQIMVFNKTKRMDKLTISQICINKHNHNW